MGSAPLLHSPHACPGVPPAPRIQALLCWVLLMAAALPFANHRQLQTCIYMVEFYIQWELC